MTNLYRALIGKSSRGQVDEFVMLRPYSPKNLLDKENVIKCTYCYGLTPIIDRFNHSMFYDCPLCKGKKFLKMHKAT